MSTTNEQLAQALRIAQQHGLAHNNGAGGQYLLCATEAQLLAFVDALRAQPAADEQAAVADLAAPSGGREGGPEEDRIEAAYWRFDARHKGYGQWKQAPMSERDAFKAELRNAIGAEKVRVGMRMAAKGWRPAAPDEQAVGQKGPGALLVRDVAAFFGVEPLGVCAALKELGLGDFSVNMAVTADMVRQLREAFAAAPPSPSTAGASRGGGAITPRAGGGTCHEVAQSRVVRWRWQFPAVQRSRPRNHARRSMAQVHGNGFHHPPASRDTARARCH